MTKIKICGLRRKEDVDIINSFLPDFAGFIISNGFRRTVAKEDFLNLAKNIDSKIKKVGVFVNETYDSILNYALYLDVLQLHGDESFEYAEKLRKESGKTTIKAIRARRHGDIERFNDYPCDYLLIDAYKEGEYGGTGKIADWSIIKKAKINKPFFLAGGISSYNVSDAIDELSPFCVDVSSSVETNGYKDRLKIKELIQKIRKEEKYE